MNNHFYTPVQRRDVLWNGPVRPSVHPSTIACERDILKTACLIGFTFWYCLKTSDDIALGHSTKTKMATTAVWRLTLYPIQNIAFERGILKTACWIDFIFWYGLNATKTLEGIDLGHSTKTKMAATAVWRLTLYPVQDIACERGRLKTACWIDFTIWYGLNTTKISDAIDFGYSTNIQTSLKINIVLYRILMAYFQVVNVIPCKCICRAYNATLSVALV